MILKKSIHKFIKCISDFLQNLKKFRNLLFYRSKTDPGQNEISLNNLKIILTEKD